jgi:hypothetical protein
LKKWFVEAKMSAEALIGLSGAIIESATPLLYVYVDQNPTENIWRC